MNATSSSTTAAWPAIRIEEDGRFELVLLKKNVLTLEDIPTTQCWPTISMLADYFDVYSGFVNSFGVIEAWLVEKFPLSRRSTKVTRRRDSLSISL